MAKQPQLSTLVFFVNGRKVKDNNIDPETTLLTYLREKLGLTGSKLGCGEGGCGACTVMVSKYHRETKQINHFSVMSCLYPVCYAHGAAVTTVEGLGSVQRGLHPIQERLSKSHGTQCGFCSPGMVMTMYTLLRNNPTPTQEQIEKGLDGNLCRCTGYRPILDGFNTFSRECAMGENCCKNKAPIPEEGMATTRFNPEEFAPYDPSQEPIFPSELQVIDRFDKESLYFNGERVKWYRPATTTELFALRKHYPEAKLVHGNTDIGTESKTTTYPVLICITHIPELHMIKMSDEGIKIGSAVTLSRIEDVLITAMDNLPAYKTRVIKALLWMLSRFGNPQIRNVATVAGNIITASPVSDLIPILTTARVKLTFLTPDGEMDSVEMDDEFIKSYRTTKVQPNQVLHSIDIPYSKKHEYFASYKQSIRRTDDKATVNAAMKVSLREDTDVIEDMYLCFGGMSTTHVVAHQAAKRAVGRVWDEKLVNDVCDWLKEDLPLSPGSPGGVTEYRQTLTVSFFFRFYLSALSQHHQAVGKAQKIAGSEVSGIEGLKRGVSTGMLLYEEVASGQPANDPVGRNQLTTSSYTHVTGETVYLDDMPTFSNELHLARVISSRTHAKILSIDWSEAIQIQGVVDFVTHEDVPGKNKWGVEEDDEELFATSEVYSQGQTIGAILADTREHALRAAKAVKITYEDLDIVVSIEDARNKNSYFNDGQKFNCGDLEAGLEEADHVIKGSIYLGGQDHFYMETHSCLAIPVNEYRQMEIISSSQWLSLTQRVVAGALGVPENHVVCKAKRLGGAFGGKITRACSFVGISAVAAIKTGRPVRCVLERDEDMISAGARHPYRGRYQVGFTSNGRITALDLDFFANGGHSLDVSQAYIIKATLHACNAYKIPNVQVTGYSCKTNIPPSTAMRAFATLPVFLTSENWITDIALYLGISPNKVREINMYKEGDLTHFSQPLTHYHLPRCWQECLTLSDFNNRRKIIDHFNSVNRWKKRGIAMTTVQQGISNTTLAANQAGALVRIYTDGSVMLSHGCSEMGQDVNTKMIQIASRVFRIDPSKVRISCTSTETVPNNSPSGASMGSDVNGFAVQEACRTLMDRLNPIAMENPKGSWEDWITAAYEARISLSSTGFYKTPDLDLDENTLHGSIFNYFTNGVGCSEVEVDCLTGDSQILRTDLVMDIGSSLNPAVDIGQIEGSFVQGCGLMLMEHPGISPTGYKRSRGPNTYKMPTARDIPLEFNVSILKGAPSPRTVYSSKGVGEPALSLSTSVLYAVKDAIIAARKDSGIDGNFSLNVPATPDKIRMACVDKFTKQFPLVESGTYTPLVVDL